MIVAVGIDMIEVERVRSALERHPQRFIERCFHPAELEELAGRSDLAPGLAARFAAKEAFQKIWHQPLSWRDAWVEKDGPKPVMSLSPALRKAFEDEGLVCHLSLTHSRQHAAAVVVLERSSAGVTEGPA
ncbi:MAG: holo-ACP synthase [Trueperaceae bacterium]|nr:holo-ACP synthase [Trueperaceae bacterium]